MTIIDEIAGDDRLSVRQREERIAEVLVVSDDLGAADALETIAHGVATAAFYAANHLAVQPDRIEEKRRAIRLVLEERSAMLGMVATLVPFADPATVDDLTRFCLEHPDADGIEGVLLQAAESFPAVVRVHEERIDDPYVREALWPGAPKRWVVAALMYWQQDRELRALEELATIRTDLARDALLGCRDEVPEDASDLFETLVENAGIVPDTGAPLVHQPTSMGLIGPRDANPHHMGRGYAGTLPACPVCERPAARLLTLSTAALPFAPGGEHDPSLFWPVCDCDVLDYLYARHTPEGTEGIMAETSAHEGDENWLPGRLSLQLHRHPNQHGRGSDAIPGLARHQIGGYPAWIRTDRFPRCPGCGRGMRFLASIDSGMSAFGRLPFEGILYGFWCGSCAVSVTHLQRDSRTPGTVT
jgi:hypothetical protein